MSVPLRSGSLARRLLLRSTVLSAVLFSIAFVGPAAAAAGTDPLGIAAAGASRTRTPVGYDISYPQCGGRYPSKPAFSIVGVNGGLVYAANPCLASEITWGGGATAQLYANTGNPNPQDSSHWPSGQTFPRICDAAVPNSADCSYDYGWYAAADSFAKAQGAYQQLGISASPAATTWWLDVETSNSWQANTANNVAALQGEVDYLQSIGVAAGRLGFYSTTAQWGTITGGSKTFSSYPSWGAGAPNQSTALSHCRSTPAFTGGRLALVQYISGSFDADVAC